MLLADVLVVLFAQLQPHSELLKNVSVAGFALFVKIIQRCEKLLWSETKEMPEQLPDEVLLTVQSALAVEAEVVEALWDAVRPVIRGLLEIPTDKDTDEALGIHGMPQRIGEACFAHAIDLLKRL